MVEAQRGARLAHQIPGKGLTHSQQAVATLQGGLRAHIAAALMLLHQHRDWHAGLTACSPSGSIPASQEGDH